MRKTFLKVSLLAVLGLGMSASFTGCKDYDPEINKLQQQIDDLNSKVEKINALVSSGSVITSVSQSAEGVTFTLSNGQSYTVTNGKAGKDADVWTIVTNADGKLVWAKNGVATDFPAQGPAGTPGENGTAEPGIYYQPNEDGFFYKVDPAKGTSEKTDISWKAKGGALSAVATADKVTLSGVPTADGGTEEVVIWRSMFIKSLVAVPGFYLDGIEATRYEVIVDQAVLKTVSDAKAESDDASEGATQGYLVPKGQPISFAGLQKDGEDVLWSANQIATLAYHVNPSNAATEGMKWNLLIDDKEVVNRSSAVSGEVLSASKVNGNGDITITYQLSNTGRLAPYSDLTAKPYANGDWTMMALQAANPETDSALVASNNVAIVKRTVDLVHLLVRQNANADWVQTWDKAANAVEQVANDPVLNGSTFAANSVVLNAAYNQVYDLASHLAVETSYLDHMLQDKDAIQTSADKNNGGENKNKPNTKTGVVMTLAQAKAKYNLTAKYQLVTYTIKPNQTSEDKFAKINGETGKITPCYVESDGTQVEIPGTTSGRSAIGRRPMVYVTLNNADGQTVLAGFVKIIYTTPSVTLDNITLSSAQVPYICDYTVSSTWEQISGAVYEKLGLTAKQFSENYKWQGGVYVGDNRTAQANAFKAQYGVDAPAGYNLGTFDCDINDNNTHTQKLTFTITPTDYACWYPTFNSNGSFSRYFVTTASVTKTVYTRFYNAAEDKNLYIGFEVTLVGAPAANYNEKLVSQWSTDLKVAPINPAVPGQTTDVTPVQKANGYPFAAAMAMSFNSVWKGGLPVPVASAPYNFTNKDGANYINPNTVKTNYVFNPVQNPATVEGLSGTVYTLSVDTDNYHALLATWKDANGNEFTEPIAAVSQDEDGMWDIVSMLPYYALNGNNEVIVPVVPPTGDIKYGNAACDIVNSQVFNKENPAITFDMLMGVTYGECDLMIPENYALEVGVGRPITLKDANTGELQDAVDGAVLASKLFTMVDWQGHLLWNTSRSGVVTTNTFNNTDLAAFWFSQKDANNKSYEVPDAPNKDNFGVIIDLAGAAVSLKSDGTEMLGQFSKVYVDKKLSIEAPSTVTVEDNVATVKNVTDLGNVKITWTNNGSAVTTNIYVYVPIYITYVWGEEIYLGDAIITVKPTLSAE